LIGQNSVIKGIITDRISEVTIIGAAVEVQTNGTTIKGSITDENGKFVIDDLTSGRYNLRITYIGYETVNIPNILVTSGKESIIDVSMDESINNLSEIIITANADKDKPLNEMASISARTFSLEEVTRYSGGRNDASRLVSNFAGVATANDSRNDIVVRGNSPAGILWRLEGVPIPNPNHFSTLGTTGGPVSALNTNLLKNSDFLTSAFPAEYGNALSGVFDVGFRSGNKDKSEYTFQLAAFSGLEAMAEGPIGKSGDKSYLVSYRYSFVQLANSLGLKFGTNATPKYQDLTFNIDLGNSKLGNFKIFGISGLSDINFIGKDLEDGDFFATKDADSRAKSQFGVAGIKYTYMIKGEKHYIRSTLSYSKSKNSFDEKRYVDTTYTESYTFSDVKDVLDRVNLHTFLNSKYSTRLNTRIGFTIDSKSIVSSVNSRDNGFDLDNDGRPDLRSIRDIDGIITTIEPYASFKYKSSEKSTWIGGLHGLIQTFKLKSAIEPRLSYSYAISNKSSVTFGYGLHSQIQPLPVFFLLSQTSSGQFLPLNEDLGFTKSHHFVTAWDYKPLKDWRVKLESYYQQLFDVPIQKESSSFSILNAGADFVFPFTGDLINGGKGRNYGVEWTVEKFFSKSYYGLFTGSIFQSKYEGSDGIERNSAFNNEYVFNLLGGREWKVGNKTTFTTDFKCTFAGGRYITPINVEASKAAGFEILFQDKAFSDKLPNYFRLDIKIGMRRNGKKLSQQFFLDFQNITNQQNVFSMRYNRISNKINTLYQIGFFPDILWRIQF
jgi:hypothetical protein